MVGVVATTGVGVEAVREDEEEEAAVECVISGTVGVIGVRDGGAVLGAVRLRVAREAAAAAAASATADTGDLDVREVEAAVE